MKDIQHLKPALLASGKLAIAATAVLTATPKTLSARIAEMEHALDVYNNEIIILAKDE